MESSPTNFDHTLKKDSADSDDWQYQIRIQVTNTNFARIVANKVLILATHPLFDILDDHNATAICQLTAFENYCDDCEAKGLTDSALYKWTKATVSLPEKQAKYIKIFTIYVDGQEVYDKSIADELEAKLQTLVGDELVEKVSKYDTNPASNPQPPKQFRS
ncbi:MAG: hypothetical protein F4039_03185 [Gammaproteobacteria bacterium]|nr:hypothetical protein [Gammaproteobacteria bacterium]MYK43078.1 hypothetical protein [Gammaproteobacteria bacterium]